MSRSSSLKLADPRPNATFGPPHGTSATAITGIAASPSSGPAGAGGVPAGNVGVGAAAAIPAVGAAPARPALAVPRPRPVGAGLPPLPTGVGLAPLPTGAGLPALAGAAAFAPASCELAAPAADGGGLPSPPTAAAPVDCALAGDLSSLCE